MKLVRFGAVGQEKPGIIDTDGKIRDLSEIVADIAGDILSDAGLDKIRSTDLSSLPIIDATTRIGACVGQVGKFLCIGLNYADHAEEAGMELPKEPVVFAKATSAICGPNDDIEIPRNSVKTDWEVELGVVIGKHAKYVDEADAMNYVAGFCLVNDLSERDFQIHRSGQWIKGKSCDTFGPIGPWLVTRDEIKNPHSLDMYLKVNGHKYQNGSTKTMVFGVEKIISHLSQFMSLHPGDVISTGTPPGVGFGQKPEIYLNIGDKMELGIEGLGVQYQTVVSGE